MDVSPPWICILPRQPGKKEQRYMHMLMGQPDLTEWADAEEERGASSSGSGSSLQGRVSQLEGEVAVLRQELQTLQEGFAQFRAQFE